MAGETGVATGLRRGEEAAVPSSMMFVGLVVLWLLILVPAVARHRQEVARPSVAALSGRVLERPRQRTGPVVGRELEVKVMDEVEQERNATIQADREDAEADREDAEDEPVDVEHDDDGGWERPAPRYRPGRGGFDPEAAAATARARYAFRQRVVLAMLIAVLVTGVIAAVAVPLVWWAHGAIDVVLVAYLVYLRRQVRLEEAIRERRAARMVGTRRGQAADDPELDGWARRGRDLTRRRLDDEDGDRYEDDLDDGVDPDDDPDGSDRDGSDLEDGLEDGSANELSREHPERVRGTGESLRSGRARRDGAGGPPADPVEGESALPRLRPAPPPPLPAGTALVEATEDDPELHDLAGPARSDYRRAAGE